MADRPARTSGVLLRHGAVEPRAERSLAAAAAAAGCSRSSRDPQRAAAPGQAAAAHRRNPVGVLAPATLAARPAGPDPRRDADRDWRGHLAARAARRRTRALS